MKNGMVVRVLGSHHGSNGTASKIVFASWISYALPMHAVQWIKWLLVAPALVIGWAFERFRSLLLCIGLHSAFNAIGFVLRGI